MTADPTRSILARVRRAAEARERAEQRYADAQGSYRAALVAAVDDLEQAGDRHPFGTIAATLGVSRQSVRQLIERAKEAR